MGLPAFLQGAAFWTAEALVEPVEVNDADLKIDTMRAQGAGGQIVVPRMAVPGIGWLAYFKDLGGNIFGMMQPDPTAA